ncbi:hypothetical protein QEV83_00645 [Methylocapsa sp. D3K7]|uniref:hypothetical protein n=1 Tax=Methylocapsa sp. D3K7 TaxID=3041435 RepID=UPI00244EF6FC|nr:hypothetical protein [Methylocapsa sp. D3K7]WGJ14865.1 hypothetical protein QEV83_00645 [Methylocapsa sp. D3K7]
MGDILDFRLGSGCERQRPLPAGPAEIVAFTGGWHRAGAGTKNQPILMRCRRRIARSLAPVWAIVSASLLDPKNRPGGAARKSNSQTPAIPKPAKRSGISP